MRQITEYHAVYEVDGDTDVDTGLSLKEARKLIAKPPPDLIEVRKWVRRGDDDLMHGDEMGELRKESTLWERK